MEVPVHSQTATVVIPATASHSAPSSPEEGRFLPGTLVAGRYRIVSLLGRGGMGEVYRATDLTLAQPVALKFLPDSGPDDVRAIERFHNEVRVARQVSHPNVCRVYDVGEAEGMPYISMEYVDGEDLSSLLHRIGRLPADKALEIARKICAGVAAAHDKGVIHRDLKPANIMLRADGSVCLIDFGLAKSSAQELELTQAREIFGTPYYMSPEQGHAETIDARSDLYSLGVIFYEMLVGTKPYKGASAMEVIHKHKRAELPTLPQQLQAYRPLIDRLLAKSPTDRFQSARELLEALTQLDAAA